MRQFQSRFYLLRCFIYMVAAAASLSLLLSCSALKPEFDEKSWRAKVLSANTDDLYAPNNNDGVFFNPWMPMEKKGFFTLLRWKLSPKKQYTEEEKQFLPNVLPEPAPRIRAAGDRDFIFWVGHGTFFLRINGQYWLTDPMFTDRALIPKRKTPPGISIDEIVALTGGDPINVIISHNHYDHLDKDSISALPDETRFYVPLGLKTFVTDLEKHNVVEMDWWQSLDLENDNELFCLPMQHWSRRIGHGYNNTLWANFLIRSPDVTLYFGGDGGYFVGHREFGQRFPGIDYALIPTTAYHPRWFMHYAHMNVDEAISAFEDLGASVFIPTQWGTFHLGDEPPGYPGLDLQRTIVERDLDPERFLILDIGGLHVIK